MKREAVQRKDIFRQGTRRATGLWKTSLRSFGINLRPTLHREPILEYIHCLTGRNLISGIHRRENIPVTPLYFDRGDGKRYRSLGCYPCTFPVESTAKNVREIIEELKSGKFANIAERAGRAQDQDDGGGLETLRRGGYM